MSASTFCSRLVLGFALLTAYPAVAADVTAERLLNAESEPQNWLMNLGNYAGHRYSGLDLINRDNVGDLVVRFSINLGGLLDSGGNYAEALPASPLVDDGYLYVVDGWGAVNKLDLRNGRVAWRSEAGQHNLDAWLEASRGIALYGNFVIAVSPDGQLHWVNRDSGAIERSVQVADPATGYSISAPPLVVNDTIIVGGSGSDRAARSRLDAIDAASGEHLWTVYPGAPDAAGGAFQQTGVYDPTSGLSYWGASHAYPQFGEEDGAVFGNAAVAVDVAAGSLAGLFTYPAQKPFSEAGTYQLIPDESGGSTLAHFGNDGSFYVFGADLEATRTTDYLAPAAQGARIETAANGVETVPWQDIADCPNVRGSPAFASAYSPRTGLAYGGGADGCHGTVAPIMTPGPPHWLGAYYAGADAATGLLSAVDPATGEVRAQHVFNFPLHAGALATAGGLVFTTSADGTLYALDDETLEPLWSTKFGSLTSVPPISFGIDGEQFIAVVVGGNAYASELSYVPEESGISQDLFVLAILGLRPEGP